MSVYLSKEAKFCLSFCCCDLFIGGGEILQETVMEVYIFMFTLKEV
jgi:hypothetical protein